MVSCDYTPPVNPSTAETGLGTMHGDTASSDTTPFSGPGTGKVNNNLITLLSICPTIVQGNDGYILALCTSILTRDPIAYMVKVTSRIIIHTNAT